MRWYKLDFEVGTFSDFIASYRNFFVCGEWSVFSYAATYTVSSPSRLVVANSMVVSINFMRL